MWHSSAAFDRRKLSVMSRGDSRDVEVADGGDEGGIVLDINTGRTDLPNLSTCYWNELCEHV